MVTDHGELGRSSVAVAPLRKARMAEPSIRHDARRGRILAVLLVLGSLGLSGCGSDEPVTDFGFDEGPEGWVAGFADYPPDQDLEIYELDSSWGALPEGLEGSGLYIQGHNRSDDLFMYWKVPIDGLEADTEYSVEVEVDLASNVPEGLVGIGGSPGESVWIKVGASTVEPVAEPDDQGWLRLNVDKGNQSSSGDDAVAVGTIANPNLDPDTADGTQFALMNLDNSGQALASRSDSDGRLWVFVGSDSGFEGPTTLYYASINVTLDELG